MPADQRQRTKVEETVDFDRLASFVDVTVQIHGDGRTELLQQQLKYRCQLRRRLHVRVKSVLTETHTFTSVPRNDTVSEDKRTWGHTGQTATGSQRWSRATAHLASREGHAGENQPDSFVMLEVTVRGDAPYNKLLPATKKVPLS